MNKPKFNPNQPFQESKPKFNPNADFQVDETPTPSTAQASEPSTMQKFANTLNAFNAGFEDMMPFKGVSDRIGAGMEAAVTDKSYDESLKSIRDERALREKGNDTAATIGKVAGFGSNLIIPGGGVKAATTMGAIEGGTRGEDLSLGGAALGAGLGYAGAKAGEVIPQVARSVKGYADDAIEAVKTPGGVLDKITNLVGSTVRRYSNTKDMSRLRNSVISRMAEEGGDASTLPTAAESMLHRMSDEEFVQYGIMTGNDDVMRWAADRAATLHPGQVSADEVYQALKMGPQARTAARDFAVNKKGYAESLAPQVSDTIDKVDNAIGSRIGNLTAEAQQQFQPRNAEGVRSKMMQAFDDASQLRSIPADTRSRIEDAWDILQQGKGPSSFNLKQSPIDEIDNVEHFRRLQKVRETLDNGIDWDAVKMGKRSLNEGETILANLRKEVDTALKSAPAKVQADEVAKLGFEIQDAVFGKTEFKGGVDEFKLKRLFGNTDEAGRFRNSLDRLSDWASNKDYAPEARQAAQDLVERFKGLYKLADDANVLSTLRYKNGPSSPAIDAFKSFHGKNSTTQDLVTATSGFLNQTDEFINQVPKFSGGKAFADMNQAEKSAVVKLRIWANKAAKDGKVPTPESMSENFQKFLKSSKK